MITRAQIRRQLRKNGGIMNAVPRQGYGIGSWVKERIRKLIPNEIANVAVKAAPFVAPFNPGIAGLMRGIGRFDQRGSVSDALKQGLLTTAGGAGARYLGGQRGMGDIMGGGLRGGFTSPISSDSPLRNLFTSKDVKKVKPIDKGEKGIDIVRKGVEKTVGKFPILKDLPPMVQQQLFVGGITAGASALHSYFTENFREKLPEETMEQYLEARRKRVGIQMRNYMDNYFKFDPEYSALDEAGKDAFVARYNKKKGGRVGLASGSPHFDPPTFSEGVPQMFMSDTLGALPKAEGGVRSEDMGILSIDDFDNLEDYRRYIQALALEMARKEKPEGRLTKDDITRMLNRITNTKAKGGRVKYKEGGGGTKKTGIKGLLEKIGENIRYKFDDFVYGEPATIGYSAGNYDQEILRDPEKRAIIREKYDTLSPEKQEYIEMYLDSIAYPDDEQYSEWLYKKPGKIKFPTDEKMKKHNEQFAKGGRVSGYGGGITANMPRISMGIPRVNAGGIRELDYRATGGFVPVGIKEKADDVPAMLSKNEFVMTADAVKGAGGGSVEKGAQRMYNTMKKLEGRVA